MKGYQLLKPEMWNTGHEIPNNLFIIVTRE
jgi:hypothetical protein